MRLLIADKMDLRVSRRDGAVYVEDLGSRNGTLLNGEPRTERGAAAAW